MKMRDGDALGGGVDGGLGRIGRSGVLDRAEGRRDMLSVYDQSKSIA